MMNQTEIDILMEMVNIGVGEAASVLSDMVNARISLNVPNIQVIEATSLNEQLPQLRGGNISSVHLSYEGALEGKAILAFPSESAVTLIRLLTRDSDDTKDMDVLRSSTLMEIGNVLLNSVMGTLGNLLCARLRFMFPEYIECELDELLKPDTSKQCYIVANTHFIVASHDIEGNIILVFELSSFEVLKVALNKADAQLDQT